MSGERFDRDLTEVLREIAGEEAPMSLRNRLSDITDRAPMGHRLWFATPMRLSVVAAAVALLALAIVFWPRTDVGPAPSDSAVPSASPSADATATADPSVAPSAEPTLIPTLAPTPAPTPVAQWTGLTWSDPVTPSFTVHLQDLVPWGDGYVAVGTVETEAGPAARILTSPDGLNWTGAFDPGDDHWPRHLAVVGDELLAFSHRWLPILPPDAVVGAPPDTFIWRSTDGEHWSDPEDWPTLMSEVGPPPSWDETQHPILAGLVDVASGPDGLVAIGNAFVDGALAPVIQHSADGHSWTAVTLPTGSDGVLLNAIAEHHGRYVITGAVGVGADPDGALVAAWYSDDGFTWVASTIEFTDPGLEHGAEFGPLWSGNDGLLTCSGRREMGAGGWRYMTGWWSTDGATWQYPGPDPGCDWSASDGRRIVALGPRDHASPMPWPGVTLAWTSTDGAEWQSLELGSTLGDRLERFWVVPDGVIYAGVQSFWFGTPTPAP